MVSQHSHCQYHVASVRTLHGLAIRPEQLHRWRAAGRAGRAAARVGKGSRSIPTCCGHLLQPQPFTFHFGMYFNGNGLQSESRIVDSSIHAWLDKSLCCGTRSSSTTVMQPRPKWPSDMPCGFDLVLGVCGFLEEQRFSTRVRIKYVRLYALALRYRTAAQMSGVYSQLRGEKENVL